MKSSFTTNSQVAQHSITRRGLVGLAGLGSLALLAAPLSAYAENEFVEEDQESHKVVDMGGTELDLPTYINSYGDAWLSHASFDIVLNGAQGLVATPANRTDNGWLYDMCPNIKNSTTAFGPTDDLQDLIDLAPQVIFAENDDLRSKLADSGIAVVNCSFSSFETMASSLEMAATVLGEGAIVNAQRYNDAIAKELARIKKATDPIEESNRPSVLYGPSVLGGVVAGAGGIADEWIGAAGGTNANAGDAGTEASPLGVEDLIALNPAFIFTGTAGEADKIMADSTWANVQAVKDKHVFTNPAGANVWGEPGAELLLQLGWASAQLHPDLFKGYEVDDAMEDFYRDFFQYDLDDEEEELILSALGPTAKPQAK